MGQMLGDTASASITSSLRASSLAPRAPCESWKIPTLGDDVVSADEKMLRAYGYWAVNERLALIAEHQFDQVSDDLERLHIHRFSIEPRLFLPSGIFARLRLSLGHQDGDFLDLSSGDKEADQDTFWLFDAAVGYRLPRRLGSVTLEARNLLDERFHFQDVDPANAVFSRERAILGRLTLIF